jgi:hypothetical protein
VKFSFFEGNFGDDDDSDDFWDWVQLKN